MLASFQLQLTAKRKTSLQSFILSSQIFCLVHMRISPDGIARFIEHAVAEVDSPFKLAIVELGFFFSNVSQPWVDLLAIS